MPFDVAKYHRDRRRAAAKKGLCTLCCKRKPLKGYKRCRKCKNQQKKAVRKMYDKRTPGKRCKACGQRIRPKRKSG